MAQFTQGQEVEINLAAYPNNHLGAITLSASFERLFAKVLSVDYLNAGTYLLEMKKGCENNFAILFGTQNPIPYFTLEENYLVGHKIKMNAGTWKPINKIPNEWDGWKVSSEI